MTVYAYDVGFRRARTLGRLRTLWMERARRGGARADTRARVGRRRVDFRTLARRPVCGTTVGFREARGNDDDDEDIVDWTKHPSWVRRVKMKTRTKSWIASQS